ncbi:hypothetical protein C0992_011631 [Termitomyces sp. T32_za158]|nr:hypothetical protein C0992_011631 [Termitomyces sp. T32_za158]
MEVMEENMLQCLDDVPLLQIQRYANCVAQFISAYQLGLSGAEAVWASKKYHGHYTLPPTMLAEVDRAQLMMAAPLE